MLFVQRALVNRLSPHFATIRWAIARGLGYGLGTGTPSMVYMQMVNLPALAC